MKLIESIKENAKKVNKCIVLPEGAEERTLKAANIILEENISRLILLGDSLEINSKAKALGLDSISKATIINPSNCHNRDKYVNLLFEIRQSKGLTLEEADKLVSNPLYFATLLIKLGEADGEVAGAINATGDVLRPAFQVIKTLPGISVVSGAFLMLFENNEYAPEGVLVLADCAVHPVPTAEELAQIALCTAVTAKNIAKIEPRVAMLSFSTKGSAKHENVDKVIEATNIAKLKEPTLLIDGELQADAALVAAVGKIKCPDSKVAGNANVLVFPSLEVGNISYKLIQRLAGAEAVGPILQGMAAPVNDLSRGCSVSDIVNLVAITANQSAGK